MEEFVLTIYAERPRNMRTRNIHSWIHFVSKFISERKGLRKKVGMWKNCEFFARKHSKDILDKILELINKAKKVKLFWTGLLFLYLNILLFHEFLLFYKFWNTNSWGWRHWFQCLYCLWPTWNLFAATYIVPWAPPAVIPKCRLSITLVDLWVWPQNKTTAFILTNNIRPTDWEFNSVAECLFCPCETLNFIYDNTHSFIFFLLFPRMLAF